MHTNRFSSLNRRQLVNPTMKAGATIPKRSSRLSLFLRSNHRLAPIVLSVCLGSLSLLGGQAAAQTTKQRPLPLPAEGRSIVSNGDSTTLVQNPANLALLPGPELRWTGQYLNEDVEIPARGNSAAVALPFGFIPIAMGLRYDMVNPPARAANQMAGDEFKYQWLTWGMSLGNEVSSIGVSYQHSYSKNALYDGWDAWNLGWTTHPMDYFGVSFIAERVNRPLNELGIALDRNYAFGTVIRPTGTSAFEIGLEGNYVDAPTGYWMPRATASFAVPYFGRVRGDVTWIDPGENAGASSWTASTALVVDINSRVSSAQLSLGTRYGTSLGSDQEVYQDLTGEVAIRGFREPDGAENVPYALTIRLERTPSNREHTQLLRSLWEMANVDRNLRAVLLELRAAPANSLAHLQELQDAIELLRSRGKQVVCSLESADGSSMYLCSSANKVLINPAGGIRYAGLKTQSFYLKGLLDKLGVQTDFVRIGRHKSAPEMFVRSEATQTAASDRAILLQQIELEMTASITRQRKLDVAEYRKAIDEGPLTAEEAKKAGLVDALAFDDTLEAKTKDYVGNDDLVFGTTEKAKTRRDRFGPAKRLAIIYVEGDMVDGRSQNIPFLNIRTAGSYTIAESIKRAREDRSVSAIVLRVETGGGSAMAADVIWRELELTKKKKPVVVSMGSAAASGGYYISAPGTYIYANPLTITGSIGIFYGKADVGGLLRKIGVNVETFRTSPHADAESIFRPFTNSERKTLSTKIEQFYGLFLKRVAEGRGLRVEDVDAVGRGRVWTGRQALEHRLVDDLGGLRQALAKARVLGGLRDDSPIVEWPIIKTSLLGKLLGVEGLRTLAQKDETSLPMNGEMLDGLRAAVPFALYEGDIPLARAEIITEIVP